MSADITLIIEDPKWRKRRGLSARLKQAAKRALAGAGRAKGGLTILLSDDERLRTLNLSFRAKDKPTNVLSFPAAPNRNDYLGDIAIAYATTAEEARSSGKRFADHAVHLVVHGTLHLIGYDHVSPKKARVMEPLEISILASLGIADPYAPKAA